MKESMDINLRELFVLIKRKLWIIILVGILFGVATGLVNEFLLKPVYQVSTTLITSKQIDEKVTPMSTNDDFTFSQKMAITYSKIIKSKVVIEQVIKNLKLNVEYEELIDYITVKNMEDTQILEISVENNNPKIAVLICNEIPKVFDKEIQRITKTSGMEVIDKASSPKQPIKPKKIKNIIIGILLGFIISTSIILMRNVLDRTVKTTKDIDKYFKFNILGVISKQKNKLLFIKDVDKRNFIHEEFIKVRTNIQYANIDEDLKVILFTSTKKNEGKSILCVNTAYKFSELQDTKVLLVDCDFRKPSVHKIVKLQNTNGIMDILMKKKSMDDVKVKINNSLDILFTGEIPSNPTEILSSKKMIGIINTLKNKYDYIFIDSPPVGVVSDSSIISRYSDAIVYVMASKEVEIDYINEALKNLKDAKIIGCILNKFDGKSLGYYKNRYYKD